MLYKFCIQTLRSSLLYVVIAMLKEICAYWLVQQQAPVVSNSDTNIIFYMLIFVLISDFLRSCFSPNKNHIEKPAVKEPNLLFFNENIWGNPVTYDLQTQTEQMIKKSALMQCRFEEWIKVALAKLKQCHVEMTDGVYVN